MSDSAEWLRERAQAFNLAVYKHRLLAIADELEAAQKEIARLRLPPEETLSAHPGCVYCMEAGTPIRLGEVCPKCGDRLPTKREYELRRELEAAQKDAQRLDKLEALTRGYGRGWILRDSSSGRGMRLHETSQSGASASARAAIDAYVERL